MTISVRPASDPEAIAALFGISVAELGERDSRQTQLGRWVATRSGRVVGVATAFTRADDRVFVVHRLTSEAAYGPLLTAATQSLSCVLYLSVSPDQSDRLFTAAAAGFTTDFTSTAFDVPIRAAQEALARLVRPVPFEIVSADNVNPDRLYQLDLELRQDIPGNDGWRGNRQWFDDEMQSAAYDPSGYAVARGTAGNLDGLCRFWRNDSGPALGMLGVTNAHRSGTLAVALLRHALDGVANWGSPIFTTHTARPALQRRMRRLGGVESGGFVRLRRGGLSP